MCKNWQTAQIFEIPNKAENVEAIVMYYTHYQRQMTHIKIEKAARKFLLSNCTLHQFCVNKKCLSPLKFRFSKKATKFETISHMICRLLKGQTNSKWFFQANVSSKKRTTKFDFTTCRLVFVRFLEESEDTKKIFRT